MSRAHQALKHLLNHATVLLPKNCIYILPFWAWGNLLAMKDSPENLNHYLDVFSDLREALEATGVRTKVTRHPKNLWDAEKIICIDVPLDHRKIKTGLSHPDRTFDFDVLPILERYPTDKLCLILWESAAVKPYNYDASHHAIFSKILTSRDDWVDNEKYFKMHLPVPRQSFTAARSKLTFGEKKLCTMIARWHTSTLTAEELYSKRVDSIEYYEKHHPEDFDLYGRHWPKNAYQTHRGIAANKIECLSRYRFSITYENSIQPGWITEKIFDCFSAACVPVYWGPKNISEYIPKECFIWRPDFESEDAVYRYLKAMPEREHRAYLRHIESFMQSEQARQFTCDSFINTVQRIFL